MNWRTALLKTVGVACALRFIAAPLFGAQPAPASAGTSALTAAATAPSAARPPYLDPDQPLDLRVLDLLARITPEEKANLMQHTSPGVPRLGVPKYNWWNEALHGVARAGEATVYPQAIGLAAMWDEPFLKKIAGAIGIEGRAKHHEAARHGKGGDRYYGLTFWSPNINIFRDPRWGRGQETYGEDPYLTTQLGMAFVRGLQGDDPKYLLTAACAKHFAVHSGPESLRHNFNVNPDEPDFYETYLPAFEALVREARVESVMMAYNAVFGKPCAISDRLYELLYRKWGFDGHVVSDCGAIKDLYTTYGVARDAAEAEAMSLKAGLCLRCGDEPAHLGEALARGLISEQAVDTQLGKLLRTMFRLGMFDPPERVAYSQIPFSANNAPEHGALALAAAEKSMVLLKNDGVLPLNGKSLKRVLVVGPNADSLPALIGNYFGTPVAPVTVLAGIRQKFGPGVQVDYVHGCDYAEPPAGPRLISRTALRIGESTGLMGHYFNNTKLEGKEVAQRRERPVSIDFASDKRPNGVNAEDISVRWIGDVLPPQRGEYEFIVRARGGVRLKVGGATVIDAWTPGEKTVSGKTRLSENTRVPVTLEYFASGGPAQLSLQWQVPGADSGFPEAVAAAKSADAIIFVGGLTAELEGEEMDLDYEGFKGGDRTRIELPPVQERLLAQLHGTGKPLVVVLMTGSAVALPWTESHANAILQAWYPGQAGGTAVANVLLGNTNPSGRLPVTFYRATEDLTPFEDYHLANRTYRYFRGKPLYAFGHGLSYTSYRYANLRAKVEDPAGPRVRVSVEVTNTGSRDGEEVVQLYANEPSSWHARAVRSLCGFSRVSLRAGETKTVTLDIPASALRRWDTAKKDYTVPRGAWRISAGASSADLRGETTVDLR